MIGPLRELAAKGINISSVDVNEIKPICMSHFESAFKQIRASVDPADLEVLKDWNKKYGSFADDKEMEDRELT
jgi:SpoVK/Ycf46/Vps4 family AAA+-type ATPase